MKKIVFVTRRMVMGGIEKALIAKLELLPKDKFDVTLIIMGTGGELINCIPEHVKVIRLYGNENSTIEKIVNAMKKGRFIKALKIGWYTLLARTTSSVFEQEMLESKILPKIETEFDLAIAYHTPASFPVIYVIDHLHAKKKAAWIHADVSVYTEELKPYDKFYEKYDRIFCVSEYAKNEFLEMYPGLKSKTSVFYNILDKEKFKLLSRESVGFNDVYEGIRILTVGRLTPQKGQDIIPSVLKRLLKEGFNIRWYLIGEGESRAELERKINEHKLEDDLILLGTKNNPFPYINECDLYVQPSRFEGYCISLAEARAFNKPIIATDFVGAREQIENGKDGIIINFDEEETYQAVKALLMNNELCNKFKENLEGKNVTTTNEIDKLLNFVG